MDGLQLAHGDLGIDLGGGERGVTQHGLDEADIGAVLLAGGITEPVHLVRP